MSYVTIDSIQKTFCPEKDTRKGIVQNPASNAAYLSKVIVPESEFQKTLFYQANSLAKRSQQGLGARDDIIRGITTKPQTFATLELVKAGESSGEVKTAEFLLQNVSEASEEKYQLVETFGEPIGFFYGSRPKIYQYSGTLLNTEDYPWKDKWKANYENEFRGTKCVEKKSRAYLTYDFVLREGYILSLSTSQDSASPNNVNFSFAMFVTREMNLKPSDISSVGNLITKAQQDKAKAEEEARKLRDLKRFKEAAAKLAEANAPKEELRKKWESLDLPPELFSQRYEDGGEEYINLYLQDAENKKEAERFAWRHKSDMEAAKAAPTGATGDTGLKTGSRDNTGLIVDGVIIVEPGE